MQRSEVIFHFSLGVAILMLAGTFNAIHTIQSASAAIGGGDIGTGGEFLPCFDDCTAPVVTVPSSPYVAEAEDSSGAHVTFSASATDNVDGPITPTCDPASGSLFSLGTTSVTCTAKDNAGWTGSASFDVVVQDTTKPVITLPLPPTAEATSSSGAEVSFSLSAQDTVDGAVEVECTPSSGSLFPLGTTSVTCSATDDAGNKATEGLSVIVQDTTKPEISVRSPLKIEATSSSGAEVSYSISADDIVDGSITPSCSPSSASFPLGTTEVTCTATDDAGNKATEEFTFTVQDTKAPSITVPSEPIQLKATSESGAIANYDVSAEDAVDGNITPECAPEAGGMFEIGDTVVKCSAEDEAGNDATKSFVIVVSPPENNLPLAILTAPSVQLQVGKELTFSADKSSDEGGQVIDYNWDFGDGGKANGVSATHSYQTPGTYTVTLEVTDDRGGKSSDVEELTVVGEGAADDTGTTTTPAADDTGTTTTPAADDTGTTAQPQSEQSRTSDNTMTYAIIGGIAAAAAIGGIVAVKKTRQRKADINIP